MGNDRILFDVIDEYKDEENDVVFKVCLKATKYGYFFQVFRKEKLFYIETEKKETSEGLKLDLPKDTSFNDKRKYCIDCSEGVIKFSNKIINSPEIKAKIEPENYKSFQDFARCVFCNIIFSLNNEIQPMNNTTENKDNEKEKPANSELKDNEIAKLFANLENNHLIIKDKKNNCYIADDYLPAILRQIFCFIDYEKIKYSKYFPKLIQNNILDMDSKRYKMDTIYKAIKRVKGKNNF
jgi:uncharacterized protein with PIN domain